MTFNPSSLPFVSSFTASNAQRKTQHDEKDSKQLNVQQPSTKSDSQMLQDITDSITQENITSKAQELLRLLTPQNLNLVAHILVFNRGMADDRYATLYADFIQFLSIPALRKLCEKELYSAARVLITHRNLCFERTIEHSQLHALGSFIGSFIIKYSRVLPANSLNLKHAIIYAYQVGKIHAILPFVSRIIAATPNSVAYHSPNQPWISSIISLLNELLELPLKEPLGCNLKDVLQHIEELDSKRRNGEAIERVQQPRELCNYTRFISAINIIAKDFIDLLQDQESPNIQSLHSQSSSFNLHPSFLQS
ncbi:MAG: hypothetical protein EZS28_050987, partial [Streblomastix strix]